MISLSGIIVVVPSARATTSTPPDDIVFSASKTYFAFGLGNTLLFPARVGGAALLVPERVEP